MSAALTDSDLQQLRHRLHERWLLLRAEIRTTLLRANTERYADIAGRMQDAQEHSLAEMLADVAQADVSRDVEEIRDIETAWQRLDTGRYGACIDCGVHIPPARLTAYPTAKRCLPCQQTHERHTGTPA